MSKRVTLLQQMRRAERAAKKQKRDPRTAPITAPAGEEQRALARGDRVVWKSKSLGEIILAEVVRAGHEAVEIGYMFAGRYQKRFVSRNQLELHRP